MSNEQRQETQAFGTSEWREGEPGEPERSGGVPNAAHGQASQSKDPNDISDPEVLDKAKRRRHTAKYKLRIIREADKCTEPGQLGALLRREGLYHSSLGTWRQQRERGELEALRGKKRGRKSSGKDKALVDENRKLSQKIERMEKRLKKAEIIIDFQKKISELMGISQKEEEAGEKD